MYKLKKGVLMFKNNIINSFKKGNNIYNNANCARYNHYNHATFSFNSNTTGLRR